MIAFVLACAKTPSRAPLATVTGEAMGGELRVVVRCPSVDLHPSCMAAASDARDEVVRLDHLLTDWKPGGEIARLNALEGDVTLDPEALLLLRTAARVSQATGGAFDATIGTLWGLWDFEHGKPADPELLARYLPSVGWTKLVIGDTTARRGPGQQVTLGGIAQGYAAQRGLARIPSTWEALVDVSGDIAVRGSWEIGIQDPRGPRGATVARVQATDTVLVTSGDYEQFFERDGIRYHHILDPRTGEPARGAWSATVLHEDGAVADALATALVVLGPDAGAVEALGAAALVVDVDGAHELGPWRERTAVAEP